MDVLFQSSCKLMHQLCNFKIVNMVQEFRSNLLMFMWFFNGKLKVQDYKASILWWDKFRNLQKIGLEAVVDLLMTHTT